MKKIVACILMLWLTSSTFAQSIDPNLVKSLSYDQLVSARKNLAMKWDNLTLLQKLKAKKYLVLIKQRLDEFALQNQNILSWANNLDFLSWKNITNIVSWTNLTTDQLVSWQSKLQSKPTTWDWWVFSSRYVWDPSARWVQIAPEQDLSKVDWSQLKQYEWYFWN